VQTTCTPASGQSFPLGATTVTCTATDAASRSAACSFNVSLKGFSIAVTRYAAYGDSLTEGQNGLDPAGAVWQPMFVDTPNAYPTKLQQLFDAQYPGQGIVVINRGHGGARIETTVEEVRQFLPVDKPGAVLILSGYNDLGPCGIGPSPLPLTPACHDATRAVGFGVRDCINRVRESGLGIQYIFVSTLTPPGPYLGGVRDRRTNPAAIIEANGAIRQMVAAQRVTLVDSYVAFVGHEAEYVNSDGLHLRPAGYQALADAFFSAIVGTVPQTPLDAGRRRFP
jgi:lysophospholipase L1-like esterase